MKIYYENEIDMAVEIINDGGDFDSIDEAIGGLLTNPYQSDEWYALNSLDYRIGDESEIKPKTLYGPLKTNYESVFVYIDELKVSSRLRPRDELWEKYPVRQNGELLEKPSNYSPCSQHGG